MITEEDIKQVYLKINKLELQVQALQSKVYSLETNHLTYGVDVAYGIDTTATINITRAMLEEAIDEPL